MYKVFFNENCITLSNQAIEGAKNILYHYINQLDEAIHFLSTSQNAYVNIYSEDLEELWFDFKNHLKIIEAAGGIVKNTQDEMLFIYRLGKWDLPKGKMEKGESREVTAIREIEEECKIYDLELKDFIMTTYHIYFQKEYILKVTHWYNVFYPGNEIPEPQIEEGIEKTEWVKDYELEEVVKNTYPNIKLLLDTYNNTNTSNYHE